ncbi:MAG: cytochrome c oxidase assembly protein, partial [Actinobacteria bacterium]|nr:cytochrome c oxidase assembly protein [Actinomycetota bacterium]
MNPWRWHAHPLAWALLFALGAAYLGAVRAGHHRGGATSRQRWCFGAGLFAVAASLTWPLGDLGGHWSALAHLGSHLLLVLVAPPLLLLGLP